MRSIWFVNPPTPPSPIPFPSLISSFCLCSKQGVTVKGRPRAEFRLTQAVVSAVKTLSANKEARLSVECIDGDKDIV